MNLGRILFLAIFLFCSSLLVTTTAFLQSLATQYLTEASSAKSAEQLKLERSYQDQLIAVLKDYSQGKNASQEQNYQQLEERLLGLTVPPLFKDLHWQLVQAFEKSNQGLTDETRQALTELVKNYSWLSAVLSSFIINNFS